MKNLFVTGLTGFVGKHLERYIQGSSEWSLMSAPDSYNLCEPDTLDALWKSAVPDAIIHLAGQTFVPEAFRDPKRTLEINLIGTLNLLQSLKRAGFNGVFLFVSSGDVYGQVSEGALPITESLLPVPRNPYAVSKQAAESLCRQWSFAEAWRIIIARPFNHAGPDQAPSFILPGIAEQLAKASAAELSEVVLAVGDVDVTRDFLHVNDVISAYLSLLKAGRNGEVYNVCSGNERSVREMILDMASLADISVDLAQDASRLRPADQRRVCGCSDKLRSETGWKPTITITETLQSILDDWQKRVRV